jgi:hypothetical protein
MILKINEAVKEGYTKKYWWRFTAILAFSGASILWDQLGSTDY